MRCMAMYRTSMDSLLQSGLINGVASFVALHVALAPRGSIPDRLINTAWLVCGANAAICALQFLSRRTLAL